MADKNKGNIPPLLSTLQGIKSDIPPMWLMRQAGRYLPEYRALRAEKGGFLQLVYDSNAAAEITKQPLQRFAMDGAILFSDILIIPYALGQGLRFAAGEGPILEPALKESDLDQFIPDFTRFDPIYETVRQVRSSLHPDITMLGFAGSPWTVATYMVNGMGSKDQRAARQMAYSEEKRFSSLIDTIIEASILYLRGQIDAGAQAVQLFDSWAGSLSPIQFERWVIEPNARIVEALHSSHKDIPIIGFPKGAGDKLMAYAQGTRVDAIGLDETVDPVVADRHLPDGLPVQGNLDPLALIAGGEILKESVSRILSAFHDRPHIFNLGHGILPETPIDHVEMLIKLVKQ